MYVIRSENKRRLVYIAVYSRITTKFVLVLVVPDEGSGEVWAERTLTEQKHLDGWQRTKRNKLSITHSATGQRLVTETGTTETISDGPFAFLLYIRTYSIEQLAFRVCVLISATAQIMFKLFDELIRTLGIIYFRVLRA